LQPLFFAPGATGVQMSAKKIIGFVPSSVPVSSFRDCPILMPVLRRRSSSGQQTPTMDFPCLESFS